MNSYETNDTYMRVLFDCLGRGFSGTSDWFYDSPPPPNSAIFVNERFMAARCYEKHIFTCYLVYKGLSNGDVGVVRATIFQKIRQGAGLKTNHFVK